MKRNHTLYGCLCAIGCEVLYGMSYIFTKQATQTASALSLLGWRFLIAFLLMSFLLVFRIVHVNIRGKNIVPLLTVAMFCPVLYFLGETFGISKTTASESGVIIACIPVVTLFASMIILRRKPKRLQVIGILITLAGVLITVVAVGMSSSFSIAGYILLSVAVVSYALYCVFVEKAGSFTEVEITYTMLGAGAVVFVALAIAEALVKDNICQLLLMPITNLDFLIAVLYGGIGCSIGAFFLSNMAISRIGSTGMASFTGIATVVSILSGVAFLHERFTFLQVIGAAVIVLGVYIANAKMKN